MRAISPGGAGWSCERVRTGGGGATIRTGVAGGRRGMRNLVTTFRRDGVDGVDGGGMASAIKTIGEGGKGRGKWGAR